MKPYRNMIGLIQEQIQHNIMAVGNILHQTAYEKYKDVALISTHKQKTIFKPDTKTTFNKKNHTLELKWAPTH